MFDDWLICILFEWAHFVIHKVLMVKVFFFHILVLFFILYYILFYHVVIFATNTVADSMNLCPFICVFVFWKRPINIPINNFFVCSANNYGEPMNEYVSWTHLILQCASIQIFKDCFMYSGMTWQLQIQRWIQLMYAL